MTPVSFGEWWWHDINQPDFSDFSELGMWFLIWCIWEHFHKPTMAHFIKSLNPVKHIYAFRRFYPKLYTMHLSYTFYQHVFFIRIKALIFMLLKQSSTTEIQDRKYRSKIEVRRMVACWFKINHKWNIDQSCFYPSDVWPILNPDKCLSSSVFTVFTLK